MKGGIVLITWDHVSFAYGAEDFACGAEDEKKEAFAVQDVSLHISKGECVVLCGRSGCGKTTLTRMVNGLVPHFYTGRLEGDILVGGIRVKEAELTGIAKMVGSVFQNPRTQFFHLDTTGEMAFNLENQNMPRQEMQKRLEQTVCRLGLQELMDRDIFQLSGGEKQQIACGSAYAARPWVMVLDEPSSNLDMEGIRKLKKLIREMKEEGKTILISEHRLWYLEGLADRYVLMEEGRITREFDRESLLALSQAERENLSLRAASLSQLRRMAPKAVLPEEQETGLEVTDLAFRRKGRPVLEVKRLKIPKGAVVAVIGENGAGKSTFCLCLSGLLKCSASKRSGGIRIAGETVPLRRLPDRAYLVMQEAGHQLFSDTVLGELFLNNESLSEEKARSILEKLGLGGMEGRHPGSLSGGQQQRLSLGVALCTDRKLMLYDEPTSGQDGENLRRTAEVIREANRQAACSLIVTHDPELILNCATHILHIHAGEIRKWMPLDERGVNEMWKVFGEDRKGERMMNRKSVWEQLTQVAFLPLYTKVVTGSLQLDIYSHLSEKTTAKELAEKMGWNEANTGYLLNGLASIGFVVREGDTYQNSEEAERYLVQGKPEYLGGFIQYYVMSEGMIPMDVVKLVTEGPQPMQQQANEQSLDFAAMGAMMRRAQAGYRQEELLRIVRSLPENEKIGNILDLGCGTGLLGLAVIADRPERIGTLMDRMPEQVIRESAENAGLSDRVTIISGDFLTDAIGSGYDLIIASAVMLFARGNYDPFLKKCYDALNPGGVLLAVSEGIEKDLTGPWDMMMGYLPYYFQGMDMAVRKDEVAEAAKIAGFTGCEKRTELLCSGMQDIDILRKQNNSAHN
ncbi:MAG TPA: ATP-binding cassette domain-containing protein [Candidatus Eisenbergiella merdavium]|uniref:ATP-binding cassette domain-containing protein n=1 Tax=Candidatus Eisenbergiella merdavium TaxID=2838551 RepID=A0A9D2NCY9_9FIRM|nr:ATP-binding cassette domain-containing protein [Candidatus Eisenbergiella merdavium]